MPDSNYILNKVKFKIIKIIIICLWFGNISKCACKNRFAIYIIIYNQNQLYITKNNFNFGDKHFLQKSGTAMGTRLAPNYANLFMDDFERQHVYTYKVPPFCGKIH